MSNHTKTSPIENKPLKILTIDDDPLFHQLFGIYAETLGYIWESATNLDEALLAIETAEENKDPFSVVTIDMQFKMGESEKPIGKSILQRIKSQNPHIACILITGSGVPGEEVLRLRDNYQLDSYISKDKFDQDKLKESIKLALEHVSRRQATSTGSTMTSSDPILTRKVKPKPRPTVFISYSHKDEKEKEELVSQLSVLQIAGLIDVWVDDRIAGGANWEDEIKQAIVQASIAILLISANFLTSDFIYGEEVPAFLKRRESQGLTVFPVIAKACAWDAFDWLAKMNVRPKNGKPIWSGTERQVDEDLSAIVKEIKDLVSSTVY